MSATPRLFIEADLASGAKVSPGADQAHYLTRVMRLSIGAKVRLFNGRDGEFETEIVAACKSGVSLIVGAAVRAQRSPTDLWLLFAPLKKVRTDFLIEKATELGAAELWPVFTTRTDADVVRTDRLARIAVEAAEQTERLDVPRVRVGMALTKALAGWDEARPLFYADESGDEGGRPWGGEAGRAAPMGDVVRRAASVRGAILIGPEGGFTREERAFLRSHAYVHPVGLGPRILRAETAAIAALTIWQSVAGDLVADLGGSL
jgi:16S rRNA (uracil1498-N3)-methyltransferase